MIISSPDFSKQISASCPRGMSSVSSGVKEFDVVSCSAIFGSIESVSVGVSGKEEPDSWIWHSSSSVMMSNTASSGGLQTGFIPWFPMDWGAASAGDTMGLGSPWLVPEPLLSGDPEPLPNFWKQARQHRSFLPPGLVTT